MDKRTISRDTYLKALALFTLATDHYKHLRESQIKMIEVLGLENDGCRHTDDAIYEENGASVRDFDEALKKENIVVADPASDPQ